MSFKTFKVMMEILDYTQSPKTIQEIAKHTNITQPTARRIVYWLETEELVEFVGLRKVHKIRPVALFQAKAKLVRS